MHTSIRAEFAYFDFTLASGFEVCPQIDFGYPQISKYGQLEPPPPLSSQKRTPPPAAPRLPMPAFDESIDSNLYRQGFKILRNICSEYSTCCGIFHGG